MSFSSSSSKSFNTDLGLSVFARLLASVRTTLFTGRHDEVSRAVSHAARVVCTCHFDTRSGFLCLPFAPGKLLELALQLKEDRRRRIQRLPLSLKSPVHGYRAQSSSLNAKRVKGRWLKSDQGKRLATRLVNSQHHAQQRTSDASIQTVVHLGVKRLDLAGPALPAGGFVLIARVLIARKRDEADGPVYMSTSDGDRV